MLAQWRLALCCLLFISGEIPRPLLVSTAVIGSPADNADNAPTPATVGDLPTFTMQPDDEDDSTVLAEETTTETAEETTTESLEETTTELLDANDVEGSGDSDSDDTTISPTTVRSATLLEVAEDDFQQASNDQRVTGGSFDDMNPDERKRFVDRLWMEYNGLTDAKNDLPCVSLGTPWLQRQRERSDGRLQLHPLCAASPRPRSTTTTMAPTTAADMGLLKLLAAETYYVSLVLINKIYF